MAKKLTKEQNLSITKIVLGVVQWVINLFTGKHGKLPENVGEMKDEYQTAKGEATQEE